MSIWFDRPGVRLIRVSASLEYFQPFNVSHSQPGYIFTIFPTIQEIFYFTNISRHLFYTNPFYVVQGRSDWLGKESVIFSIELIEKHQKKK